MNFIAPSDSEHANLCSTDGEEQRIFHNKLVSQKENFWNRHTAAMLSLLCLQLIFGSAFAP